MNEDNLQRGVKKVISFGVFTAGILAVLAGLFLIINYFVSSQPYLFEGAVAIGMGIIMMYSVDQSILNTKRHDMLKEMIKENNVQAQRQRGGGGILGSILGEVGLGGSPMNIEIIRGDESSLLKGLEEMTGESFEKPNSKEEIQEVMLKTNLNEEDAETIVSIRNLNLDELRVKREQFKDDDRFELLVFVDQMILSKKEKNKSDDNGNKTE